jgi:FkbM family methyltransferase
VIEKTIEGLDLVICCDTPLEEWRVNTFYTKEPGTLRWLASLRKDDILYDIGANIGLYSLYGALLVKHVYAFEPHVGNASSLLRNIARNKLQDKITVLTVALDNTNGLDNFLYRSVESGSSDSQARVSKFKPAATELKTICSLSTLWMETSLPYPDAVKIDVDGREHYVLNGMCLASNQNRIRTMQVEVHPDNATQIHEAMDLYGLSATVRHETSNGLAAVAAGKPYPYNQIFERVAVTV